jgi:hypothetical protein
MRHLQRCDIPGKWPRKTSPFILVLVPASGIYECDCNREHSFSTDFKGYPFPPLPEDCAGTVWKLKSATKLR